MCKNISCDSVTSAVIVGAGSSICQRQTGAIRCSVLSFLAASFLSAAHRKCHQRHRRFHQLFINQRHVSARIKAARCAPNPHRALGHCSRRRIGRSRCKLAARVRQSPCPSSQKNATVLIWVLRSLSRKRDAN